MLILYFQQPPKVSITAGPVLEMRKTGLEQLNKLPMLPRKQHNT